MRFVTLTKSELRAKFKKVFTSLCHVYTFAMILIQNLKLQAQSIYQQQYRTVLYLLVLFVILSKKFQRFVLFSTFRAIEVQISQKFIHISPFHTKNDHRTKCEISSIFRLFHVNSVPFFTLQYFSSPRSTMLYFLVIFEVRISKKIMYISPILSKDDRHTKCESSRAFSDRSITNV